MNETIDELMGFNPQNLDVFQEKTSTTQNHHIYKTSPATSKSDDGHYRCKVKVIYNPRNIKQSIVNQATYAMHDSQGFFSVKSKLADGDRNCPIFSAWKKLWFAPGNDVDKKGNKCDLANREWCKDMFDKSESRWVLVQVQEDDNQPDQVGQIKLMKLPSVIYDKMQAKMNPAAESKKQPVPVMDYLIGLPLEMDVVPGPDDKDKPERKQRETSYNLCEFSVDYAPITKIDNEPLFDDDELSIIEDYNTARNQYFKAKTDAEKSKRLVELQTQSANVKPLYTKAVNYLQSIENEIPNLIDECAYKEWDPATTIRVQNWIDKVLQKIDPKTEGVVNTPSTPVTEPNKSDGPQFRDPVDPMMEITKESEGISMGDDDLPF